MNDDAVERWKEARTFRPAKLSHFMTADERAADDWLRARGVDQATRDAMRARARETNKETP